MYILKILGGYLDHHHPTLDPHLMIDRRDGYQNTLLPSLQLQIVKTVHVTGSDIDSLFNVNDIRIRT